MSSYYQILLAHLFGPEGELGSGVSSGVFAFSALYLLEEPLLHPGIQKNCHLYLLLVWFDNQDSLLGYHHHSDLNFPPLLHTAIMETTRYSRHALLNVSALYLIMAKTSS